MKATCTQENLLAGLQRVAHIAGKNASLPVLSNVLIRAERGRINLSATNLEAGIASHIRGKVEQDGAITVPANVLVEYVSLLPNDVVELTTTEDDTLHITTKTRTTKLKGVSAEEFPVLPDVEEQATFTLEARLLKQAINQVAYAVASDDARPEISGILLRVEQNQCRLVATDSYRLSERVFASKGDATLSAIIPARTLIELNRVLSDEGDVAVTAAASQIRFQTNESELVSRLIEGQYPDYQQIIPDESVVTVDVRSDALMQAVRSVSLFCKSGINDVVFTIETAKKRLIVQATNAQVGESTAVIDATVHEGSDLRIVFNYRYLTDGLQHIPGDTVQFRLVDENSPGILAPMEGKEFLYLLMPIKQ